MSEQMPPPMQPPEPVGPVQPAAPSRDNVQVYGILGIVLAVICCPLLGILFGYLSIQEARRYGKDDTLGKVALWIGIGITALGVLAAIISACAGFGSWMDHSY